MRLYMQKDEKYGIMSVGKECSGKNWQGETNEMRRKSILRQLMLPIIAIVCALAAGLSCVIVAVFSASYEAEAFRKSEEKSRLVSGEIAMFLDGAYRIAEELSVSPGMLSMRTNEQKPALEGCAERNPFFELLYIQGTDGMQTGRSSGELADRSARWWFVQTMEEKKPFISKSYYSVNTGMPCASIFFPMRDGEEMVGVFAADIRLDYLQDLIEEFSDDGQGEYSFVIDGEGVVVAHPDGAQVEELYNYKEMTRTVPAEGAGVSSGTDADGGIATVEEPFEISEDYRAAIADAMKGNCGHCRIEKEDGTYFASYAPVSLKGESDSWSVITLQKSSSAMAAVYRLIWITAVAALLAIAAAVIVIAALARRLTKPVASMTELIGRASDGDFTMRADESVPNEIGILSGRFNRMIEKMSGILRKITAFSGEVVQSSAHLKRMQEKADSIHAAMREIADGSADQDKDVARVVMRASELEEKFAQLREKRSFLLEDARNVILSGESGKKCVDDLMRRASETAEAMEASYSRIAGLKERSEKISGIVGAIGGISSQTGLLALNASIEAARAGEAGRGFSVVAESVGKLAADSATATKDIEAIIDELCRDIDGAVSGIEAVREGSDGQAAIVAAVRDVFGDFNELAEKTKDSVDGMEELVEEMHACDRSIVHAAERIRVISEHAGELTEEVAGDLKEQAEGIRHVAGRIDDLSMVSKEIEQELTMFKLEE